MSTQFLLDEDDIKELTKLMLVMIETQESRKQICRELGINPQEVSFIIGTSDDTFCTELIDCLNRYGYQEYLCKLCCDKLFPILDKSVYSHRISILKKIIEKLNCNCNQEKQNHPITTIPNPDESKSESLFTKIGSVNKKLLAGGAILLVGLAGFAIHMQISPPVVDPKYINLEELLKARNWEEADNVTSTITRTILGKDKAHPLYINDIKTFPCTDLHTIEQLWLKYSDKRFGFSKQKQIISNLVVTQTQQQKKQDYAWKEFLNQVAWNGVISEQNAPDGHFPAIGTWWFAYQPGWLETLFSRVDACKADKWDRNP